MSKETYQWLANNVIAGFQDTRPVWWHKYAQAEGWEPMTYPGAIPVERVKELLCSWEPTLSRILDEDTAIAAIQSGLTGDDLIAAVRTARLPSHKNVKRDNRHIGLIGIDAATHLYGDWLVGTVQETVKPDELEISSTGLLRDGAQAWVQIERPQSAVGPGGIAFSAYVMLSTSLDGSWASQINQNQTFVICDNTANIGRGQNVSFKHTSQSGSKLGAYRGVMAAIMRGETDFKAELERMLSVKVSPDAFGRFLDKFVPIDEINDKPAKKTRSERKRQEITALYHNDPRVVQWTGTEFGLVQAVSTWNQHVSQLRNATGYEMTDTDLRAMRNYSQAMRGNTGADNATSEVLRSVLV